MENVVIQQIVLSSVHRTLHAHHFARASSQASLVLADLLSRYLSVLTSTSAQYAEHAGRTGITAADAFAALEEMGVPVDELRQYGQTEGAEFSQTYTVKTQRRDEELLELKAYLAEGLNQDRSDAFTLRYLPNSRAAIAQDTDSEISDVEPTVEAGKPAYEPPSPVSNPSVGDDRPSRKRARSSDGEEDAPADKRARFGGSRASSMRPPEIPSHLPPFPDLSAPSTTNADAEKPVVAMSSVASVPAAAPAAPAVAPSAQKPPDASSSSPSRPVPAAGGPTITANAASASADYRASISYEQSALASQPDWHLPPAPPSLPPPMVRSEATKDKDDESNVGPVHIELLKTVTAAQKLRLAAHAEDDSAAAQQLGLAPVPTPARHKVAMALLNTVSLPEEVGEDTLYGHVGQPGPPRVAAQPPSQPKAIHAPGAPPGSKVSHPPIASRPALPGPPLGKNTYALASLAKTTVSAAVYERVSRLQPPSMQTRSNGQNVLYGEPQPAPWNPPDDPSLIPEREKERPTEPALTPAELYATWPIEAHDYRAGLKRRVPPPR